MVAKEVVLREYPKTSYLLNDKHIEAAGNLILTNERLVFLRQVDSLSEKEIETLQQIAQDTTKLIEFGLYLHKKNLELPLSDIVAVKMRMFSYFPIRTYLRIDYTSKKKIKSLGFTFIPSLLKRLMMAEFPTLDWISAIKRAMKAKQKSAMKF